MVTRKALIGFPGGSDGKESACNAGDLSSIPGSGRSPGEWNGNPLQYSCLEKSMGRGAMGYSPWGLKKLDMTEGLTLSLSFKVLIVAKGLFWNSRDCGINSVVFLTLHME